MAEAVTMATLARELGRSKEEIVELVEDGRLPRPTMFRQSGDSFVSLWTRAELAEHAGRATPAPPPPTDYVRFAEVCRELGRSRQDVETMVRARMLPKPVAVISDKDGDRTSLVWSRADLDKYYRPAGPGRVLEWLTRTVAGR